MTKKITVPIIELPDGAKADCPAIEAAIRAAGVTASAVQDGARIILEVQQ